MNAQMSKAVTDANEQIDALWEQEVEFLQTLGRYPSTLGNEAEIQQFISDYLADTLHLEVDQFDPDPEQLQDLPGFSPPLLDYENRPVVVGKATNDGGKTGKSLILQGHIDVVPEDPLSQWSCNPWGSTIDHGKMYGRGIQDMKSGVAAMIFAYQAIQKAGIQLGADLYLQTVIEEECTGNGALAALARGYTADAALIPEPFGEKAVTSQLGVFWVRFTIQGQGAHTERASEVVNAIEKSQVIIDALKSFEVHLNEKERHPDFLHHPHPLNVNIGTLHSGAWPSSVPSEAVLEARVGLYPGEDIEAVQQEFKDWMLKACAADAWLKEVPPTIEFIGFHAEGAELSKQDPVMKILEASHEDVNNTPLDYTAVTCTTDTRFYNLYYGIPSTCYGPSGDGMHGVDEWVDLESVKRVTKVYADFILRWCGIQKIES
ncbi:acetylornithine deacetylase [Salsuginibacillus halophilus]|uniref:Acetylornithine deacetylase n=1 Tax=Salsuginibacillus halophilus TaxID=517424 RepID=A0A2P8H9M8_9BACI|nr:ArgE/DapE family deacylase [Salsuginibacillus halophilus]PSL42943.1 acetylornithine deacetylase [Salsuginibacillus halophilus]